MRILALDTATEACSVALLVGGEILARTEEPGNGHAQIILPMIDELLASAGIGLHALQGIAVGIGPGAFTGVRIGVSVAQGLAFSAALPVMAVNSLEALAMHFNSRAGAANEVSLATEANFEPVDVLACLDARMGEIYWAVYRTDAANGLLEVSAPRLSDPADLVVGLNWAPSDAASASVVRAIGRGFKSYPGLAQQAGALLEEADTACLPQAAQIARLAQVRARLDAWLEPAQLQPLYLRDKVAQTEAERAQQARTGVIRSS